MAAGDVVLNLAPLIPGRLLKPLGAGSRLAAGLLFPPTCAHCRRLIATQAVFPQLCQSCREQFSPQEPTCPSCGLARASGTSRCSQCAERRFSFDGVTSLGAYQGTLADAVLQMKYGGGQSLAYALGRHLADLLSSTGRDECYDLVVCATKHWTKRLITGINSPEVIMQGLADQANLPHASDVLVCRRRIAKQSMLSPTRRRQNVKNAWSVSSKYEFQEARILLVDDILTTGATADAMAKALKQSGAAYVGIAVVGRATK